MPGGVQALPGKSRGGPEVLRKPAKTRKKQKNAAPELVGEDSTQQHQDFVQEVPVGQMAQGTPFGACRGPPPPHFQEKKPPKGGFVI